MIKEFFVEVDNQWFESNYKNITWSNCQINNSILVDIPEQNENCRKLMQSHSEYLTNINKSFQIIKLSLQKKSDELEYININLKKTLKKQIVKLRKQDQLIFIQQKQLSLDNIVPLVAHQWKQPLHELSINNIYLLEKNKSQSNKRIYEDNDEIIQFLSSTINAFQDFYKLSNKNKFSPKEAIESTILILNSSIRQYNIDICFHFKDENIELNGERNIFSQIILSILENAISICIERNIENPKIEIKLKVINNDLIISIEDNGGGIKEQNLPYIFDITKSFRKKKSSGIGLYLANLIIEKFKGTINAKNAQKGAKFTIAIPL